MPFFSIKLNKIKTKCIGSINKQHDDWDSIRMLRMGHGIEGKIGNVSADSKRVPY